MRENECLFDLLLSSGFWNSAFDTDTFLDGSAVRGFFGKLYRQRPGFHEYVQDKRRGT